MTAPEISPDYRILTPASLPGQLARWPSVAARLGGKQADWTVTEVSDGNMNAVFAVRGPAGDVIVKQALPYIRVIGESWPFPLSRIHFEHEALLVHNRLAPQFVPEIFHYDAAQAALVMERLQPHIVLRKGLVQGRIYPRLAEQMVVFLARTLFFTSDLALSTPEKKRLMAQFAGNAELCETTEDVIFAGPYWNAPLNRWTSPQLDAAVADLRADNDARLAASELKLVFRTATEALIHGDLHTGSIMATAEDTRVIDAEWAFHGPMGFDLGALIGNLLLAYFSQPGHATAGDPRVEQQAWLLRTVERIWTMFEAEFLALWRAQDSALLPVDLFPRPAMADALRRRRLAAIFADAIGFAGAKMIRRLVGISHVEDMEAIADPDRRAACEARALRCARHMMVQRRSLPDIAAVTALAAQIVAER